MNKTVLIIDDDKVLRAGLAKGLRDAGFDVITADGAETAGEILMRVTPDAIVLDRMMMGMDGLSFLQKIRAAGDVTPTIMLTALGGTENAIDGLAGGANDYLAKPFQLKELVLRLHNIIKNSAKPENKLPDGLTVSENEFYVYKKLLTLSTAEKDLMQQLISPMGNTVMALPMVAKRLRTKLNSVLSGYDIVTVRGRGYKLTANG